MDKIRALTVFRRVVELGSFVAAAEDLKLSKAAISKNINELESYLKSPLINRTTRNLHITDNGQLYYQQVCRVLDALNEADLSVIESSRVLKGKLKISAPMSLGITEINPLICEFMRQHPELSIEMVMSDEHLDLIEQGVDIAIRGGGDLGNTSLRSRKLLDIRRVLCASPEYLANAGAFESLEDIYHHRLLSYSLSSTAKRWHFRHQDSVKELELPSSVYMVNSGLALTQAACAGLGVAVLPDFFIEEQLASGELVEILPEWQMEMHALYIVYPYHKEQSYKIRAFIDFVVQHFDK
ncbi:transcriptional regulator [Photobacterium aquae]|uniref:Transcriptional regulator n=1 Tax=Photobacterium aquae TaxID=1195763 RepID=A0A0J1GY81_9GAMM|nr:LysR family transcriptional regulator [Photobacterium aquae]KLV04616.1 transcriptional regulator [Photobacterium aquae]